MKIEKDIPYSEQTKVMLENFKDFNKEDFEKWFIDNLSIGSNNILQYLLDKKKKLKSNILLQSEVKNGSQFK